MRGAKRKGRPRRKKSSALYVREHRQKYQKTIEMRNNHLSQAMDERRIVKAEVGPEGKDGDEEIPSNYSGSKSVKSRRGRPRKTKVSAVYTRNNRRSKVSPPLKRTRCDRDPENAFNCVSCVEHGNEGNSRKITVAKRGIRGSSESMFQESTILTSESNRRWFLDLLIGLLVKGVILMGKRVDGRKGSSRGGQMYFCDSNYGLELMIKIMTTINTHKISSGAGVVQIPSSRRFYAM